MELAEQLVWAHTPGSRRHFFPRSHSHLVAQLKPGPVKRPWGPELSAGLSEKPLAGVKRPLQGEL